MDKRFLAIIGVILLVFVGIIAFRGNKTNAPSSSSGQPTSHIEGKNTTGVTLVEYGDYECPVCKVYFSTVEQVQQKYADKVAFQFRNLPLSSIHRNAFAAARAAEAADMQGKFWQMHNLLYQNQDPNGQSGWVASSNALNDYFLSYAKQSGLDANKFKLDYDSITVNNRINADIAAFKKTGQDQATPTFFINGKYVPNSDLVDNSGPTVDAFSKVLDAAIAQQAKK